MQRSVLFAEHSRTQKRLVYYRLYFELKKKTNPKPKTKAKLPHTYELQYKI